MDFALWTPILRTGSRRIYVMHVWWQHVYVKHSKNTLLTKAMARSTQNVMSYVYMHLYTILVNMKKRKIMENHHYKKKEKQRKNIRTHLTKWVMFSPSVPTACHINNCAEETRCLASLMPKLRSWKGSKPPQIPPPSNESRPYLSSFFWQLTIHKWCIKIARPLKAMMSQKLAAHQLLKQHPVTSRTNKKLGIGHTILINFDILSCVKLCGKSHKSRPRGKRFASTNHASPASVNDLDRPGIGHLQTSYPNLKNETLRAEAL